RRQVVRSEGPDHEREDEEPAVVDRDRDAEGASEAPTVVHAASVTVAAGSALKIGWVIAERRFSDAPQAGPSPIPATTATLARQKNASRERVRRTRCWIAPSAPSPSTALPHRPRSTRASRTTSAARAARSASTPS